MFWRWSLAGSVTDDTDSRLTQAQNDSVRAIIRRYMDAFDGQVLSGVERRRAPTSRRLTNYQLDC